MNNVQKMAFAISVAAAFVSVKVIASAYPSAGPEDLAAEEVYSPYAGNDFPNQVLFGDVHHHTRLSPDAGLLGTTMTASDSYRLARGEEIISNSGQPVQLVRPLDFLAITDHAEYIGLAPMVMRSDPLLLADEYGKFLHDNFRAGQEGAMKAFSAILEDANTGNKRLDNPELEKAIWNEFLEEAEPFNEPGRFTALTGFEWSSVPGGNNLHRVVIFGDGVGKTGQVLPYGLFESEDPEDLWAYMADYEKKTGGMITASPHNGNLSNGRMFELKRFNGKKMTKEYALLRQKWEPNHEMTQMKGDEETHPLLSPEDEFADYETWDVANLDGTGAKTEEMLPFEYARSTLKNGLELQEKIGANPFKYGFIGATDNHTGLPTSREENYYGKYAKTEPSKKRHNYEVIPASDPALRIMTSQEQAGGLTAVWARENTRRDIVGAMKRREVYATTGTRIRVRVFAGWDFKADEAGRPDFAEQGYQRGVPMGSDLSAAPEGASPSFLVRAVRDPDGANLDRVQIIKGWLDDNGDAQERVYDVAVADGRTIGADGRAREVVGNTVNIEKATYTNTIGDAVLAAHWEDPDFDAGQSAFYYVRVLEIPTPRWTTRDAAFYDIELPTTVPPTVQDRAYTSSIWYNAE